MTIPNFNPVFVSGFPSSEPLFPPVQPFTQRDGATYLKTLEIMSSFVTKLPEVLNADLEKFDENNKEEIEKLVGSVNDTIGEISTSINDLVGVINAELEQQTTDVNAAIDNNNQKIDDQIAENIVTIDNKISELMTDVNNAIEQIVDSTIEVSDPVIAGILDGDNTNLSNSILNSRYEPKSDMYEIYNHRSSQLQKIKQIVSTGDTATRSFAVIGDSISCGAWASTDRNLWGIRGYAHRLAKLLNVSHGNGNFLGRGSLPFFDDSGLWNIGQSVSDNTGIMCSGVALRNGATAKRVMSTDDGDFVNITSVNGVDSNISVFRGSADITPTILTSKLHNCDVDSGGWQSIASTILRESEIGHTYGIRMTSTSDANALLFTPFGVDGISVSGRERIFVGCEIFNSSRVSTNAIIVRFFNAAGTQIQETTVVSKASVSTSSYISLGDSIAVPAGAIFAQMLVRVNAAKSGDRNYVRCLRMYPVTTGSVTINGFSNVSGEISIKGPVSGTLRVSSVSVTKSGVGMRVHALTTSGAGSDKINATETYVDSMIVNGISFAVIMLGANDVKAEYPTSQVDYLENIDRLVSTLIEKNISVVLVKPPYRLNMQMPDQNLYYDKLKTICDTHDVSMVDIGDYWMYDSDYYYDNIHPNNLGHSDIAHVLHDAITKRSLTVNG